MLFVRSTYWLTLIMAVGLIQTSNGEERPSIHLNADAARNAKCILRGTVAKVTKWMVHPKGGSKRRSERHLVVTVSELEVLKGSLPDGTAALEFYNKQDTSDRFGIAHGFPLKGERGIFYLDREDERSELSNKYPFRVILFESNAARAVREHIKELAPQDWSKCLAYNNDFFSAAGASNRWVAPRFFTPGVRELSWYRDGDMGDLRLFSLRFNTSRFGFYYVVKGAPPGKLSWNNMFVVQSDGSGDIKTIHTVDELVDLFNIYQSPAQDYDSARRIARVFFKTRKELFRPGWNLDYGIGPSADVKYGNRIESTDEEWLFRYYIRLPRQALGAIEGVLAIQRDTGRMRVVEEDKIRKAAAKRVYPGLQAEIVKEVEAEKKAD